MSRKVFLAVKQMCFLFLYVTCSHALASTLQLSYPMSDHAHFPESEASRQLLYGVRANPPQERGLREVKPGWWKSVDPNGGALALPSRRTPSVSLRQSHKTIVSRGLARTLIAGGFQLVFQHIDTVVSSTLAYHGMTEVYRNMTAALPRSKHHRWPSVKYIAVTYGSLKLVFYSSLSVITPEFALEIAELILDILEMAVIVTFALVAYSANVVIWVSMQLAEGRNPETGMITG